MVLIEHINAVVLLPFYDDRVGNGSNMPPPVFDAFPRVFIEAATAAHVMRLGALVDLKEVPDILNFFDDRLFLQVIVMMKNRSPG
jgi:hypothetical protein